MGARVCVHVWTLGWVLTRNRFWRCCQVEISWIVALILPSEVILGYVDLWLIDQSSVIDSNHPAKHSIFSFQRFSFTRKLLHNPRT